MPALDVEVCLQPSVKALPPGLQAALHELLVSRGRTLTPGLFSLRGLAPRMRAIIKHARICELVGAC